LNFGVEQSLKAGVVSMNRKLRYSMCRFFFGVRCAASN
jgi:hypothetical protein